MEPEGDEVREVRKHRNVGVYGGLGRGLAGGKGEEEGGLRVMVRGDQKVVDEQEF